MELEWDEQKKLEQDLRRAREKQKSMDIYEKYKAKDAKQVCLRACVCVCVPARARVCVCVCACVRWVCVCVCGGGGSLWLTRCEDVYCTGNIDDGPEVIRFGLLGEAPSNFVLQVIISSSLNSKLKS